MEFALLTLEDPRATSAELVFQLTLITVALEQLGHLS